MKRRFLKQDTKKLRCQATIKLFEILLFPDYKLNVDSQTNRKRTSASLRRDFNEGKAAYERHICICLADDHTGHNTGEMGGLQQPIDKDLISKIHELVGDGVRNVSEMKRHLKIYVETVIFRGQIPSRSNRRYYPTRRTIKNHMYNCTIKKRLSHIDQDNLEKLSQQWKAGGDNIYFRPYTGQQVDTEDTEREEDDDDEVEEEIEGDDIITKGDRISNRLLFVHQTNWQSRLLMRYGQEMAFLDATYKTTKYAVPLYFLAVKTNTNYQVVAEFVVQDETTEALTEAMGIIKSWNPEWKPRNFITDLCEEEINAIESQFSDCDVLICTFHREQAWERWLTKKDNGVSESKEEVLNYTRRIANARTEDDFDDALEDFTTSDIWEKSEKLRKWFSNTWLRHKKRWVCAYRTARLLVYVNTNNGLERQNGAFKHQYLCSLRKFTLSAMLRILIEEYLPDKYEVYIGENSTSSGEHRKYNAQLPPYLHDRPRYLIDHCRQRLTATSDITYSCIKIVNESGCFEVTSTSNPKTVYTVSFSDPQRAGFPSCECPDWLRWYLPCKHMLAIIQHDMYTWDKLPEDYRQSAFLTLDKEILFQTVSSINTTANPDETEPQDIRSQNVEPTDTQHESSIDQPTRTQITRCCDLLASIRNLIYECSDARSLTALEEHLQEAKQNLSASLEKENGIVITKKPNKLQLKKTKKPKKQLPPISIKRARKHPYSGRHGAHAEMMRKMYNTKLSVDEILEQDRPDRAMDNSSGIHVAKEQCESRRKPQIKSNRLQLNKTKEKINQTAKQESTIDIMSFVSCIGTNDITTIFNTCYTSNMSKPQRPQALCEEVADETNVPLALLMEAQRDHPTDIENVADFLTQKQLHEKNVDASRAGDAYVLAAAILLKSWKLKADPCKVLETLKRLPLHSTDELHRLKNLKMPTTTKQRIGNHSITTRDLKTLLPRKWINDRLSFNDYIWIIVPICTNSHWLLLAANVRERKVTVLDSIAQKDRKDKYVDLWKKYVAVRDRAMGSEALDWQEDVIPCTQQRDDHSCGVFTLMNAKAITSGVPPIVMRQNHVAAYRTLILKKIISRSQSNANAKLVVCDLPFCAKPDDTQPTMSHIQWIECERCGRWCHLTCANIEAVPNEFVCIICQK